MLNASVLLSCGTTYGKAGSGDSLPIHRTHSDLIPRLETEQSRFQTEVRRKLIIF